MIDMDLDAIKSDFFHRNNKCAETQTGLCISTFVDHSLKRIIAINLLHVNSIFLASLCSSEGWFEPYLDTNPEDRYSCDLT